MSTKVGRLFFRVARVLPYVLVCVITGGLIAKQLGLEVSLNKGEPTAATSSIWQSSYEEAVGLARSSNKPLMVYFAADWCAPCVKLEETTFRDSAVLEELGKMLAVKVDGSDMTPDVSAIFSKYKVYNLPVIAFFRPPDKILKSPRIRGYIQGGELVKYLQEISTSNN